MSCETNFPACAAGIRVVKITLGAAMNTSVRKGEIREDAFTGGLESHSSRIPSSGYLGFAIGSMAISAALKLMGKDDLALFVGQWA